MRKNYELYSVSKYEQEFGIFWNKRRCKLEDTELFLRKLMISEMKLAQYLVNELKFERVHHMGDIPATLPS
jgi:hypothetical protein